jgi:excisionase family DNA binding protein
LQPSLRVIEPPIETRPDRLTQSGALELMRAAAGLSYGDVGRQLGIPRAKAIRLIRGAYIKPRRAQLERLRDLLFDRLPARPARLRISAGAAFLTLQEAARMLALKPSEVRRLICRHREIGAIKVGTKIRIPRQGIVDFLYEPQIAGDREPQGMSRGELAQVLRVREGVIRWATEHGLVKTIRRGRFVTIPTREIERLLRRGTQELRFRKSDLPKSRRGRARR